MTTLTCPAKINLYLAILEKDETGCHKLNTVFARVATLFDTLTLEPSDELKIEFSPADGIDPANNTLTKAIQLLEEKTGLTFRYAISVHKGIPLQSGLGGGSSDAATLLLFLNQHEGLGLSLDELMQLGAHVGKDVPFFLSGCDVAHGTGYGDLITPLPALPKNLHIEIESEFTPTSTAEAFKKWDETPHEKAPSLEALLEALNVQDASKIVNALHNDFESITVFPEQKQVRILAGSGGAHAAVGVVDN